MKGNAARKQPTVLWVGENRKRCETLMEIYSDVVRSVYAENAGAGFLRGVGKEYGAVVLVLGYDERADTAACREVYLYSSKKRVPIFLMGQRFHLHIAAQISPNAEVIRVRDDRLAEALAARGTSPTPAVHAVAVFSELAECFVYVENSLSAELREKLRLIYCEPTPEAFLRLKSRGIKPKLFAFGEDVYHGPKSALLRAVYRQARFRRIPYLLLSFSDGIRELDKALPAPVAILDIRRKKSAAEEYVRAVLKIK